MNVTVDGCTFYVSTEADVFRLCFAVQALEALALGKAA
jgi:hypothetical protein